MSFPETVILTPGEIMRSGTTQVLPLGTRGILRDGRAYRYCKAGGNIAIGLLVQCELPGIQMASPQTSFLSPLLSTFNTTVGTTWQSWGIRMSAALAAAALTADEYKEGYLFVGSTGRVTGLGQRWKIKSHTGVTASSTEVVTFTIEDDEYPMVAFTTDVALGMCKNEYDDVIVVAQAAEPTSTVIGVCPVAVASGDYFWAQTWGRGIAYCGDAVTVRAAVIGCTDAASTGLAPGTSGTSIVLNQILGYVPDAVVAGAYALVDLKISP